MGFAIKTLTNTNKKAICCCVIKSLHGVFKETEQLHFFFIAGLMSIIKIVGEIKSYSARMFINSYFGDCVF